jgi:hypothetical protein
MKVRRIIALALFATPAGAERLQPQTTDVALGIEALARRDIRGAEAAFARAANGPNVQLRPSGLQWRAHVAWRIRGDLPAAARHIEQALTLSRWNSQVLMDKARIEGARRRYRDAARTASEALTSSVDAERRGLILRTIVQLELDAAFSAPANVMPDSLDVRLLARARDTLAARVARFHGRTTDARALIDAGVLLGDPRAVRDGLRSYVALRPDGVAAGIDSAIARGELVGALAATGLYESAALLLRNTGGQIPAGLAEIPVYARFLRDARQASELHYRKSIAGTAKPGDMMRALNTIGRRLWPRLRWPDGKAPSYYPAALYRELAQRFGTTISVEQNRGVDELQLAHRIGSHAVRVEGREASVAVLDGFVATGFDAWLLDETGGRAGWVARDTIFMRRTGFTETPFRALVALTDPQTMPSELFRITRDSVGDLERAKRDSLGYLPGVAARVFRDGAQSLLDSIPDPATLTRALYENLTATSIVLHESRHLADLRSGRASTPVEDEYRAKLDEVTGAPHPRLALTAILSPNIGDASPHGQANRRIMVGLARWIRRNGPTIQGYDVTTPALLQLPLLSDAQLRAAFASMRRP